MGLHSCGAQLFYGATSPAAIELAEIKEIVPPGGEVGVTDTTRLNETNCTRTKRPGWIDEGQFTFVAQFEKGEYATINGLKGVNDTFFRIRTAAEDGDAAGSTFDCQGFITSIDWDPISTESDDALQATITIEIDGEVTFAQGA